jgi:hypothetical protein
MVTQKLLLITHPVDLGNAAYERNLAAMLDVTGFETRHVSFAPGDLGADHGRRSVRIASQARRALNAATLIGILRVARLEGRTVLIQGVSTALFTMPFRRGLRTFVILDWTRKLFEPFLNVTMSPPWVTALHRRAMLSVEGLIGVTDAVLQNLRDDRINRCYRRRTAEPQR